MAEKHDEVRAKDFSPLLREARKRFEQAADYERENREIAQEDMRFIAGEQWPEGVKRQREQQNRPVLTINRLRTFVRQVVNDSRQNKPAVKVHPVDSKSDPALAETFNGLIRHIEYASNADVAYDTALEHAASGGFGYFRILTEYADDDSFDQDIRIRRITNPFTVYFDPNANEYDKSDAQWCFVTEWIDREEFKRRYPKAELTEWEADGQYENQQNWIEQDRVRVAEYWCKKPVTKRLGLLGDGSTVDLDKVPQGLPLEVIRERTVQTHEVVRYLLAGHQVLEGPEKWAGRYIPIVPVYGPEIHLEGKTLYESLIRWAKDPQRQYNYWQTQITEKVALAPKAPFMVTPKQIAGFEGLWGNANTENRAYLAYNPDPQAPPPQRQQPAAINAAELQQAAQAIDDMKATTGIFDASLGAQGNETSGRAIVARQRQGDKATFGWIDNLARSIQHAGRILIDLIPKIYDTDRIVRVLGIDGSEEFVPINQQVYDPATGQVVVINDLSAGKYDVTVSVGPSYQTQRLEAAESLLAFVQAVPQAGAVSMDLIAKNLDWPGSDELAKRLKKLLPPGILDPNDPDAPPPQEPPPEAQIEMQKAQLELAEKEGEVEEQQLENAKRQLELAAQSGQLQEVVAAEVQRILMGMMGPPQPAEQPISTEPGPPGLFDANSLPVG